MTISIRNPDFIISLVTEDAVQDGDLVIIGATNGQCRLPLAANPTTPFLGIVYRPGSTATIAANNTVDIITSGIYPVRSAGVITRGDNVTSGGADGTSQAAAPGAGVNVAVIGTALYSGVATDRVPVLIARQIMQGA